jgi:hypothetical protein
VRVKLDENLPDSVLSILGGAGHDVDTARAEGLRGAKDPAVLAGATADGRLLLTLDRGLGDIRAYPRAPTPGSWWSGSTTNRRAPSGMPSNASPPRSISPTSEDALRCGVRMNFASVGPNRDHPSSVENYARLGRSPRESL